MFDRNGPLIPGYGAGRDVYGPELGFGWVMGDALDEPVLLIKCAWGGKSLAVDFRPPSAGRPSYSLGANTDAALAADPSILGKYYRETLALTKAALADLKNLVPGSNGRYVLSGFGWHQGWNDRINDKFNQEYESNLAHFIRDMRRDLDASGLPFVIAETGMTGPDEKHPRALSLMKAQAAVAERPEFRGNIAFVGTRDFWRPAEQSPSGQGYHWNANAETYYLIGEAMGEAMKRLLGLPSSPRAKTSTPSPAAPAAAAGTDKPVQAYLLFGQSNMLGFGTVAGDRDGTLEHAVRAKGKYPYLVDDRGNWTMRDDVRYVRVMGSGTGPMKQFNNEWLTVSGRAVGPELGIGHALGDAIDAPVLILKSCIGNRSLGWDLLPPGSKQFEEDGLVYAGYQDSPDKWKKGETPAAIGWYAGMQYDGDVANAKTVLAALDRYYPGATAYEVAGFFWWQGDKDRYNAVHADRYEENLVRLIEQLRADFNAPRAKFVCATLGQTRKGAAGNDGKILKAQRAVDGARGKYPQFKGNVATVYTHPLSHGGASNSHYNKHAETYMDVGEAMGEAMVALLNHR